MSFRMAIHGKCTTQTCSLSHRHGPYSLTYGWYDVLNHASMRNAEQSHVHKIIGVVAVNFVICPRLVLTLYT